MLSISCAGAFATSLMAGPQTLHTVASADGRTPDAADLFGEASLSFSFVTVDSV